MLYLNVVRKHFAMLFIAITLRYSVISNKNPLSIQLKLWLVNVGNKILTTKPLFS